MPVCVFAEGEDSDVVFIDPIAQQPLDSVGKQVRLPSTRPCKNEGWSREVSTISS